VKIIFQIFNCKPIYEDYSYNYSYRKFNFHCLPRYSFTCSVGRGVMSNTGTWCLMVKIVYDGWCVSGGCQMVYDGVRWFSDGVWWCVMVEMCQIELNWIEFISKYAYSTLHFPSYIIYLCLHIWKKDYNKPKRLLRVVLVEIILSYNVNICLFLKSIR
jgi:hypothetical protein